MTDAIPQDCPVCLIYLNGLTVKGEKTDVKNRSLDSML